MTKLSLEYECSAPDKNHPWFVLFTIPHHEKNVRNNLDRIGVETFLPMRKEVRQWSDRKKKFEIPYFPNYIFVNIGRTDRYKVFDVPGIVRYLDSNQNPTEVREKEITVLKQLQLGNRVLDVTPEVFLKGDTVTVTSGPLKEVAGTLVETRGGKRLVVQIESIKKSVWVEIPAYQLKKTSSPGIYNPTTEGNFCMASL